MDEREFYSQGVDIQEGLREAERRRQEAEADVLEEAEERGGIWKALIEPLLAFFQAAFTKVWSGFNAYNAWWIEAIQKLATGEALTISREAWDRNWEGFRAQGLLDSDDVAALNSLYDSFAGLRGPILPIISIVIVLRLFSSMIDVVGGTVTQRMNKSFSPMVPPPESVVRTSFIAPELHEKVVDALKRTGLSEDDIKLLFVSQYSLYSPAEVAELYWRGELDEEAANNRMMEMGFTRERVAELKKLWNRIPPMQDIIRYLGKEAFEPDMIRKFGLLDDYPRGEAEKWATANGYAPGWAEKEWIAHWRDLGVQFMLEALHRRVKLRNGQLVDAAFVDDYMRLIEIPPTLREIVRETSYNPFTRVDARRMHDLGVLDDDELVGVYMDQGYDEWHAEKMALFTIEYNQRNGRELTRADILAAYEDGDISFNQGVGLLVEIDYKEEYAGFLLGRVDLEKERALREEAIEAVKARYLANLITDPEARNQLMSAGLNVTRANELVNRWSVSRIQNMKLPSKTDLDKMFKHGIITEAEYRRELGRLGYREEYVAWFVSLSQV